MKFRAIPFLLLFLFSSQPLHAQRTLLTDSLLALAAFEGLVVAHSWLLMKSPEVYGVASGSLYPFAGFESEKNAAYWTTLAAAEGMNLYNLDMARNDYTEEKILKRNIIG